MKKGLKMKCILLSEELRKRIVHKVKPKRSSFTSFQYLNLLSGVTDEEKSITLTRIYFMSEAIRKSGDAYDEAGFIVLAPEKSFSVFFREYYHGERYRHIKSPCPELISDSELLEMIKYYNSTFSERAKIEKQSEEYQKAYLSFYRNYTDMYLNQEYFLSENAGDGKTPITRRRKKRSSQKSKISPESEEEMSVLVVIGFAAAALICLVFIINSISK